MWAPAQLMHLMVGEEQVVCECPCAAHFEQMDVVRWQEEVAWSNW